VRRAAEKLAPWLAGLVLLGGVAAFAATRLQGSDRVATVTVSPAAATVPLDPLAREVAKEFVGTAVARRQLGRAWRLAAPSLRGHLTLKQWRTGNIPVLPYPVARATVSYSVEESHPGRALLGLTFLPRKGSGAQPGQYTMGLVRIAGRWRVASYAAASPVGPGG
jgi:hypothetical protein